MREREFAVTRRFVNFMRVDCFRRGMSDHAMMATTSTRMYPVRPVVVLSKKFNPHSRVMYELRNIHEDGHNDRRRRHDAATDAADTTDAGAKMPDDVVTQVNRLLQVSVSFRFRFVSARPRPIYRPYPPRLEAAAATMVAIVRSSKRDMVTPPENSADTLICDRPGK